MYKKLKPYIDRILALILLIFSAPLLLIISLLIKLDSPGPVIFSQIRLGKDGKRFRFYKFRTMWNDSRQRFPQLYKYQYSQEELKTLRFKVPQDLRLTKLGKRLRKTSLDELPNLVNVLRGEVSLVGPRPEIPQMLRYYRSDQLLKFSVKPGATGYAQIKGRGLLTFQKTIRYDLNYIKEQGPVTDFRIFVQTIWAIIRSFGAF